MDGQAALSLGSIVNRLMYVFPCSSFQSLHAQTLKLFMDAMTDLTCTFLQAVAKEEEVCSLTLSLLQGCTEYVLYQITHYATGTYSVHPKLLTALVRILPASHMVKTIKPLTNKLARAW